MPQAWRMTGPAHSKEIGIAKSLSKVHFSFESHRTPEVSWKAMTYVLYTLFFSLKEFHLDCGVPYDQISRD